MIRKLRVRHLVFALIACATIVACALLVAYKQYTDRIVCDTVTITGEIIPRMFTEVRGCLIGSTAPKKTVVINSGGGDAETALALGMLIHQYGWDVKVQNVCASACANYIFPAGKTKYLEPTALLVFHGGAHQANLRESVKALASMAGKKPAPLPASTGIKDREGQLNFVSDTAPARRQVRNFLGVQDVQPPFEILDNLARLEDEFYKLLGVKSDLPTYGQVGKYREIYTSYKFAGFVYSLKSLDHLGVKNIETRGGEWRPELHPHYKEAYPVLYP